MLEVRKQQILKLATDRKDNVGPAIAAAVGSGAGVGAALLAKKKLDKYDKKWFRTKTPRQRKVYKALAKAGLIVGVPLLAAGAGVATAKAHKKLKERLGKDEYERYNQSDY